MTRLDLYLVKNDLVSSRNRAQEMIREGKVKVDTVVVTKPSYQVQNEIITLAKDSMPVSRGYYKLETGLDAFNLSVENKFCLDVGASTGGFTELLLEKGACHVVALDVGRDQLREKLKKDPRVWDCSGVNIRGVTPSDFPHSFDLITIDVSFLSLRHVLPVVRPLLSLNGEVLALIKPQFEMGKKVYHKKGVIRDGDIHREIIESLVLFSKETGFRPQGVVPAKITGGNGNQEYILYLIQS